MTELSSNGVVVGSLRRRSVVAAGIVLGTACLAPVWMGGCSQQAPSSESAAPLAVTDLPAGYVRLARGLHPGARPELDRGPLDPQKRIANLSMAFNLSAAQRADREALKEALVDPKSPSFRKFLSVSEYAARFGAPAATIERAKGWLASQGLTVHEDSPLGARVTFSGTVETLQNAFRTEMRRYDSDGELHYAMRTAPGLPADLAGMVAEISNTNDFYPKPMSIRSPSPAYKGGSYTGFTPPDWANVYDVAPLYTKGVGGAPINGAGVTIGIVGVAQIAQSDVNQWRKALGLPATTITMTLVPNTGVATPGSGGSGFEAFLDVEWSGGVASGASVNYVYIGGDDQNVDDATYYAIENNLTMVLSESWGGCEYYYLQAGYGAAQQNLIDIYGSAANVLGITYVASSGDSGATGCGGKGMGAGLYSTVPAGYPGVTAVGGTQFPQTALSGTPYFTGYSTLEAVWNEADNPNSNRGVGSGSGGISLIFDRPSYQSGIPTCTPLGSLPMTGVTAANQRQLPDVSFTAAAGGSAPDQVTSLMMCTVIASAGDCSATGGAPAFQAGGGTSFAAPAFAGAVALMVQAAGGRLGNINPMLYTMATTTPGAFHDIALGNNEILCTAADPGCPAAGGKYGYPAVAGYDCASGLGSMDVYNAVSVIAAQAATTTVLGVAPNPTTEGATVNFTATVSVPTPNAEDVGGLVTFGFATTDADAGLDLSWTLGTGTVTGTTAAGTATFAGAVPPGLVKPGMQSVTVVAMYGGDASHLPSTSAPVTLGFGALAFAVQPAMPTTAPGGTIDFTSTGGVAPVQWFTGVDTTCNMPTGMVQPTCSVIKPNTGVFTAGPVAGMTQVQALDADGAEFYVTVNVVCPTTTCPTAMNCGSISDGCGGMITCGSCTGNDTCGGAGTANVCGCTPATTCPSGDACGTASDGCGGMVTCGTCAAGETCSANQCVSSTTSSSSTSTTTTSTSSGAGGAGGGEGAGGSSTGTAGGTNVVKSGCSCKAAGEPLDAQGTSLGAFGMLALAGIVRSRKRRQG